MSSPRDRGFAVISNNDDGTMTVAVCSAISNGQPTGVYARHVGVSNVRVGVDVRLVPAGPQRYTDSVVEVYLGDGVVHVSAPSTLRALR
jgi:hypothetical protein